MYEKIGSFNGVEKMLKAYNNGVGPTKNTIKRRLRIRFEQKNQDFDNWIFQYFNPETERSLIVGRNIHIILEDLFIKFTRNEQLNSFFEIKPSRYDTDFQCDNSLIVDIQSIVNLERNQRIIKISNRIKEINIDYTLSTDLDVIKKKCFKFYQGEEKLLIIVILSSKMLNKSDLSKLEIPYRKNVKILNSEKFAQFIGYKLNPLIYQQYQKAINLAINAMFDDSCLEELTRVAVESKNNLVKIADDIKSKSNLNYNPLQQEGFENYLKNGTKTDLSYLLYKDVDKIGILKFS